MDVTTIVIQLPMFKAFLTQSDIPVMQHHFIEEEKWQECVNRRANRQSHRDGGAPRYQSLRAQQGTGRAYLATPSSPDRQPLTNEFISGRRTQTTKLSRAKSEAPAHRVRFERVSSIAVGPRSSQSRPQQGTTQSSVTQVVESSTTTTTTTVTSMQPMVIDNTHAALDQQHISDNANRRITESADVDVANNHVSSQFVDKSSASERFSSERDLRLGKSKPRSSIRVGRKFVR